MGYSELQAEPCAVEPCRRLIGRDGEFAMIAEHMQEVIKGEVRGLFVSGPPGIGKSRIATEIASRFGDSGGVVISVHCARHDSTRGLSGLMQVVPQIIDLPGAARWTRMRWNG